MGRATARRWRPAGAAFALAGLVASVVGCGPGFTPRAARGPAAVTEGAGGGAETAQGASTGTGAGTGAGTGESDWEVALPGAADREGMPEANGVNSVPAGANGAMAPASRYAALDRGRCEAELGARNIGFERVGEARGVIAPLRLTGPIAGVDFHSMLPAAQRRTSPYEIYDCRLVLALDDWARVLARHDVVEVVHYSV